MITRFPYGGGTTIQVNDRSSPTIRMRGASLSGKARSKSSRRAASQRPAAMRARCSR